MAWDEYKKKVQSSRDLIVIPELFENLKNIQGLGVDVGCGDGDLTDLISDKLNLKVIGIDLDSASIKKAKQNRKPNTRYLIGDLTNRAIGKTGIKYQFAYSNCFFNHLDNHSTVACIDDLCSSLSDDSIFVMLVPHWKRAEEKYNDIKCCPWGLSAVPEYGNKQYFRFGEWYCKALSDSGFDIVTHRDILIPNKSGLSERYRDDVGKCIFTLIVAKISQNPHQVEVMKKAFEVAHDNRKFEIEMLWRRSLFYWGFIASSFIGYVSVSEQDNNISSLVAGFGFICSLAWSAGNRGSKYWQEYWENKVVLYQNRVTGDLFIDHFPLKAKFWDHFSARRMSVSKLVIGISDYTMVVWLLLLIYKLPLYQEFYNASLAELHITVFMVATILYSVYLIFTCKSED